MNHLKVYDCIINNAKSKNRQKLKKTDPNYVYYENHHIIPKCLDGTNDKDNLVLLFAREHYICHKLLTHIYKGNRKLACALHKMTYGNSNRHIKTSRDYAYIRELISNTPISIETKLKMSISGKGRKHTIEAKNKIRDSKLGKKMSDETRKKFSDWQRGKTWEERCGLNAIKMKENHIIRMKGNTIRRGTKFSRESIERLSLAHKNNPFPKILCIYCNKKIGSNNYKRFHDENCKCKPGNENKSFKHRIDKCKYCGTIMDISNLHRYHNENCKYKNNFIN